MQQCAASALDLEKIMGAESVGRIPSASMTQEGTVRPNTIRRNAMSVAESYAVANGPSAEGAKQSSARGGDAAYETTGVIRRRRGVAGSVAN